MSDSLIDATSDAGRLARNFFSRPTLTVARDLLGKRLIRCEDGVRVGGTIIETEAYVGPGDLGCHARAGRTARNEVMWGAAGFTYVYFNYGMHWLLNFVTEAEGFPAAVLIRGIAAEEGIPIIRERRKGRPRKEWTNGPAKLCQALAIDRGMNGVDLCAARSELFVEDSGEVPESRVERGPRVGLYSVPEPWKSIDWRFRIAG